MRYNILLCIFFLPTLTYAQIDSVRHDLIPKQVDSVEFSVWKIHTKEMSIPGNVQEYEKELERVTLTKEDQELFIINMLDSKSYNQSRALLFHYNLVFHFYNKDSVIAEVKVSTMTGNIDIDNKLNNSYFRSNCSEQLGKVLFYLLNRYNLLELIDSEFYLEGITTGSKK